MSLNSRSWLACISLSQDENGEASRILKTFCGCCRYMNLSCNILKQISKEDLFICEEEKSGGSGYKYEVCEETRFKELDA